MVLENNFLLSIEPLMHFWTAIMEVQIMTFCFERTKSGRNKIFSCSTVKSSLCIYFCFLRVKCQLCVLYRYPRQGELKTVNLAQFLIVCLAYSSTCKSSVNIYPALLLKRRFERFSTAYISSNQILLMWEWGLWLGHWKSSEAFQMQESVLEIYWAVS